MRKLAWALAAVTAAAASAAAQPADPDPDAADADASAAEGERPAPDEEDSSPAEQRLRVTPDLMRYVPFDGRTFSPPLGAAPGAGSRRQLLDATAYENAYLIDGLDTTGLRYGDLQMLLPVDFLQSVDIVTGGLGADRAGSTGALIAVATKSGGDRTHGSVFATTSLASLAGARHSIPTSATIAAEWTLVRDADVGFEIGGPIVEGALWYYVGAAPRAYDYDIDRVVRSRVDHDGDGREDLDADGNLLLRELERRTIPDPTRVVPYVAKLSAAPAAGHQGYLSVFGLRTDEDTIGVAGADSAMQSTTRTDLFNAVASWSSTLRDGRTRIEARFGGYRATRDTTPLDPAAADVPQWQLWTWSLGDLGDLTGESPQVQAACLDNGPGDPYPAITSCPIDHYFVGGIGDTRDTVATRVAGALAASERFDAAGAHRLRVGAEIESDTLDESRAYSGGRWGWLGPSGPVPNLQLHQYVEVDPDGPDVCGDERCRILDELELSNTTRRWAASIHDRWSATPGLTIDGGLRYSEQHLDGDHLELTGQWAPRAGIAYDWTGRGRARAFAHWGRYYEPIPLELSNRSLNDYYTLRTYCRVDRDVRPETESCDEPELYWLSRAVPSPVLPGTRAPFEDETLAGVEVEMTDWLWLGATYRHRQLGRALEDVFAGPFDELVIANPDEADRRYDALHLQAHGAVTDRFAVYGTYTYASARGRYPGPPGSHAAPIFDLPENDANLDGPLPQSRPHALQLLGYYVAPLGGAYDAIVGARVTALSGTPIETRGRHWLYGYNEVDLIERGHAGRTDFVTTADLQITMRRRISKTMAAELHLAVFNLLDSQTATAVDPNYTYDATVPIAGGGPSDLLFGKRANISDGIETSDPITRNPDYGRPWAFHDPRTVRIGMRLLF